MAKKKTTVSKGGLITTLAFYGIVISAVAWLISFILGQVGVDAKIAGILDIIAKVLMTIVALVVAYGYVRNRKNIAYHIIYWVAAAIAIIFSILFVVL